MKKLLLIPALLVGSIALATDYKYEVTPLIGYNIAEGNIDLDNYAVFGVEIQYNDLDCIIKPELSIFYSKADYNINNADDTDLWRVALSGVYEYDKLGAIIPLAKIGLGYENMSDPYSIQTGNHNSPFVNAGLGAKIPFNDEIALKLEAIYMLKYNDARYDSNLILTAGLNIAFGPKAQKPAPAQEPIAKAVVVLDEEPVAVKPVVIPVDGDDDKDGVLNSIDKCPTTATGEAVDVDGCPASVNLNINFENNSFNVETTSDANIQKFADFLITYTTYSAKIIGYTDSRGSAIYNQKLSENRASVVKDILIKKGVPADRISSIGMGEVNPVADNASSEGRAENRRIEAELIRN